MMLVVSLAVWCEKGGGEGIFEFRDAVNPEEVLEDKFKMLNQARKCIRKWNIFFSGGIYIYREKKVGSVISTIVSGSCAKDGGYR